MSCLGVHFSLSAEEVEELRSMKDEKDRLIHVESVIETTYMNETPGRVAESDKAWDAMHRALADGQLSWDGGVYPLNHVVLGGEILYTEPNYIMSLKTPRQVRDIAAALPVLTRENLRLRYDTIDTESYGFPLTDEDFEYTWDWFQGVREFYLRAASEGRYVLFTVDQ
jgi:hypothetical protein